jgi:hypothetical protein
MCQVVPRRQRPDQLAGFRARLGRLSAAAAVAVSLVGTSVDPATAHKIYDGLWSVEIIAHEGRCIARTIVISVRDGEVSFVGFGATAKGTVSLTGRFRANFTREENVIKASGSVKGVTGEGKWHSTKCAGRWTARRG